MFSTYFAIGVFAGIMIPALLVSALHGVTIKILELFKIYKKGNVYTEVSDYITGAGLHRTAKAYIGIDKNGFPQIVSGKVFGYLVLIFLPLSIIFSLIIFLIG